MEDKSFDISKWNENYKVFKEAYENCRDYL